MRAALASVLCLGAAASMLWAHGSADWSTSFTVAWYGVFSCSIALALGAVTIAAIVESVDTTKRLKIVALAVPALAAALVLLWVIATVAPLAD
jgi:hypothetical protein